MCGFCNGNTRGGYAEKTIHTEVVDDFCSFEVNIYDDEIEINPYRFHYSADWVGEVFTGFTFKINYCPICGQKLEER